MNPAYREAVEKVHEDDHDEEEEYEEEEVAEGRGQGQVRELWKRTVFQIQQLN